VLYIQVYPDHFSARVVGGDRSIRKDCNALDNTRGELSDFERPRLALKELIHELVPGFSFRKPVALMHFIPEHYTPTQEEVASFKKTAERAGVSFCWISKWETPHTNSELENLAHAL
jgi:hypothetical protein